MDLILRMEPFADRGKGLVLLPKLLLLKAKGHLHCSMHIQIMHKNVHTK